MKKKNWSFVHDTHLLVTNNYMLCCKLFASASFCVARNNLRFEKNYITDI